MRGKPVTTATARVARLRRRLRRPWYGAWWVLAAPFWGLGLVQLGMILMWTSFPHQEWVLRQEWSATQRRLAQVEAWQEPLLAALRLHRRPERRKWTQPWGRSHAR